MEKNILMHTILKTGSMPCVRVDTLIEFLKRISRISYLECGMNRLHGLVLIEERNHDNFEDVKKEI